MYAMGTLLLHSNDAQKQRYLPSIAAGKLRLQAFGVIEPTKGTDASSIKTFARREGNSYSSAFRRSGRRATSIPT
jgi:acyl-CoA dehydrogenase